MGKDTRTNEQLRRDHDAVVAYLVDYAERDPEGYKAYMARLGPVQATRAQNMVEDATCS